MNSSRPLSPEFRIYVAGHRGMVGSAVVRRLRLEGYANIVTRTHDELDLTDQGAVRDLFRKEKIDYIVLAAAKVGGIYANNAYPAEFIWKNIMIEANVIHEALMASIERLLFLGSSCIYPRDAPQPMKEECLLTGKLEPTNEPYAIAKIAGIKLCEAYNRQYGTKYRSVMPTNLYGPNDNFDLQTSHVLPALMRKFHLAKLAARGDWEGIQKDESKFGLISQDIRTSLDLSRQSSTSSPKVTIWGTGAPRREFLHVDDMAAACVFVMSLPDEQFYPFLLPDSSIQKKNVPSALTPVSFVNVGTGKDMTIAELAETIKDVIGFDGEIVFNTNKPDGTPRKLLDTSRINSMGWRHTINIWEGIRQTYEWYLK